MSSTSKTEKLGLNVWTLTDRPHMADFNADNAALEAALSTHFADSTAHLTAQEHESLDNRISFVTYFGTNLPTKDITLPCVPKFVVVFPMGRPPAGSRCLFGFASPSYCSSGLAVKNSVLTVSYSDTDTSGAALNMSGVTYAVAVFR